MNIEKNIQYKEFNRTSKEEQVLREIFLNTKLEYINEHFLVFNFGDKLLLTYDDLNNNVIFDIEMIYDELKINHVDYLNSKTDEISETIRKLMSEVFNIENIANLTPN